jgi:hypothetical protein
VRTKCITKYWKEGGESFGMLIIKKKYIQAALKQSKTFTHLMPTRLDKYLTISLKFAL